jgi:hypothetical protein
VSHLWLLAEDGVVFSVLWEHVSARCYEEMDPDASVSPVQRTVPVDYSKWRLETLPTPAALVRCSNVSQ